MFDEIISLIKSKDLNVEEFLNLYNSGDFQNLFKLSILKDIFPLTEYLYLNEDVKFYLQYYTSNLDSNFFDEINNDNSSSIYKINYSKNKSDSLEFLSYYKRFSKLGKDENGFFYKFKN